MRFGCGQAKRRATINWQPQFTQQDVSILDQATLYEGHIKLLRYRYRFNLFQGGQSPEVTREMVLRQPAAAILLYNPQHDTVTLVEQLRLGALESEQSPWVLEPVAGLIELEQTPVQTAIREAKEEADCAVLDLEPICTYWVSCGFTSEQCHLFCGKIAECDPGSVHGLAQEAEDIKVHELPLDTAMTMIESGQICTAMAIISVQWLKLNRARLLKKWQT